MKELIALWNLELKTCGVIPNQSMIEVRLFFNWNFCFVQRRSEIFFFFDILGFWSWFF